jgi:hypothetical protein
MKRMMMLFLYCCTAVLFAAEEESPYLWNGKIKSVSVFKNGYGFFVNQGQVDLRDGWCLTRQIPPAAFGTLAVFSTETDHVVDVIGAGTGEIIEFDNYDTADSPANKKQRLESCLNLKVQLFYKHKGQDFQAEGKLLSVGDYAILENSSNNYAVPVLEISKLQILELPVRIHVLGEKKESPKHTELAMAYLRKGITWIPEYTIKILDDKTAEITLRGTLVNEAEDLVHCDINFVVGVPNFAHAEYMAPIAVGQVIRSIGASLAPTSAISQQIMNQAAIAYNNAGPADMGIINEPVQMGGDLSKSLGNLPQLDSVGSADYTVYTKKDMTLRKGEKAIVTLFTVKVSYSDLYRWSIPGKMNHFLVLQNTSDSAWTTGPYLAVSNLRPLSEDLLKYTPRNSPCEIQITEAINLANSSKEIETARQLKAHEVNTNYFDLVTLSGEIVVQNYENKPVDIVIAVNVPGSPTEASDKGMIDKDAGKLKLTERQGKVTWKIRLDSKEKKTLTYAYQRYVSSL